MELKKIQLQRDKMQQDLAIKKQELKIKKAQAAKKPTTKK
jgi:hypothetical protein